jgi:hypothetical protein
MRCSILFAMCAVTRLFAEPVRLRGGGAGNRPHLHEVARIQAGI